MTYFMVATCDGDRIADDKFTSVVDRKSTSCRRIDRANPTAFQFPNGARERERYEKAREPKAEEEEDRE
jgi:hypothetical protein